MIKQTIQRTAWALICFISLWSCGEKRPENIVSQDKMVQVILDVYLAEGKISHLNVKRDSSMIIFKEFEGRLLAKHGLGKSQYKESMSYYYDRPDELEKIYEGVLDSLNIREQRLRDKEEKEREEEKARKEEEKKKEEKENEAGEDNEEKE